MTRMLFFWKKNKKIYIYFRQFMLFLWWLSFSNDYHKFFKHIFKYLLESNDQNGVTCKAAIEM